jgi:hypothetical protein
VVGIRNGVAVSRAYIFCAITIPFHPCWTLWGHGRRCNAFSKCRCNFRMRSKLGRGSKEGIFVPTRAYTSSYVMVASIFAGYDFVHSSTECDGVIVDPSMLGLHDDIHGEGVYCCLLIGILRTVESAQLWHGIAIKIRQKVVLSINGNSMPCG